MFSTERIPVLLQIGSINLHSQYGCSIGPTYRYSFYLVKGNRIGAALCQSTNQAKWLFQLDQKAQVECLMELIYALKHSGKVARDLVPIL